MGPQATENGNAQVEKPETTVNTEGTDPDKSEPKPKSEGNEQSAKTYTEAEYKGLQAVIAKRDQTITKLTTERDEALAKLAEAEANHGSAISEKTNLSQELTEKTGKVEELENQVAKLTKKIEFKDILLNEFSDLGPAAKFVPEVETEEEFRERAKEVQATVNQLAKRRVAETLSGSSPPIEEANERTTPGVDPLDEAYDKVMRLAGNPDKQAEYEKANKEYLDLLDSRNN